MKNSTLQDLFIFFKKLIMMLTGKIKFFEEIKAFFS